LGEVSTNFRDIEALREECKQGKAYGFTGKQAIHPNQIDVIHEVFSPSQKEVERAVRLLTEFVKESQEGRRGSWEFEGQMVDKPVISLARRVLYLAKGFDMSLDVVEPLLRQVEEAIAEGKEKDALDEDEEYGPP
jgi:citrate lyase subunit beta-like protein